MLDDFSWRSVKTKVHRDSELLRKVMFPVTLLACQTCRLNLAVGAVLFPQLVDFFVCESDLRVVANVYGIRNLTLDNSDSDGVALCITFDLNHARIIQIVNQHNGVILKLIGFTF